MAAPGFRLSQNASQEMQLLPRMLQFIEVLQIPAGELSSHIEKLAQENEALSVEPPKRRGDVQASLDHDAMLQNQAAPEKGVVEMVEEQLAMLELEPQLCEWVRFLVECLDERGYLSTEEEQLYALARERGMTLEEAPLGHAISILQSLEPRGLGGRNAIESMLLQLDPHDPEYGLLCRLLEEFLEELAKNQLPSVAKAMDLTLPELDGLLERLRGLDPRPASELAGAAAPLVLPEIRVERGPDGFEVSLDKSGLPGVSIDEAIVSATRDRGNTDEWRAYLKKKLNEARWVVDAVAQRSDTLERIAILVFDQQRAYLEDGPGHLAPCRMNDIGEQLGLHVSTISRAVAGKYVQTPWGVKPLRYFFQGAVGGGDDVARDDVRETVAKIFEEEDKCAPLSDDEVCLVLAKKGLELARRTVAKYRNELGIPSSYRRKKHV